MLHQHFSRSNIDCLACSLFWSSSKCNLRVIGQKASGRGENPVFEGPFARSVSRETSGLWAGIPRADAERHLASRMVRPLALSVLLVLPPPSSIVPPRRIRSAHSPCAYILCRASGHLGSSLRDVVVYGFGTIDDTRGAMNRTEALRILGLDNDATADDIKAAYKETAQILHPDRFAGNKKLQDRATEQFKNLQEAYEYLTKGRARGRVRMLRTRVRAPSQAISRRAWLASPPRARSW